MSFDETLLQKLAEASVHKGEQTVTARDARGATVEVQAEQVEGVGSKIQSATFTRATPAPLKPWADGLCRKATGLLEPLRLLEVDTGVGTALLRSDSPAKRGEGVAYYEVLLREQGTAELKRYQATPGKGKRQQVPYTFTHEALAKLADDLTADI